MLKGVRVNTDTETTTTGSFQQYRDYTYDSLGQLKTEVNHTTKDSTVYTYDTVGNMTQRVITNSNTGNTTTVTYIYSTDPDSDGDGESESGWADMLTQIRTVVTDSDGNVISDVVETADYDAIGNPTSYRGATLNWHARQLEGYSKNGKWVTYDYDANGQRTYKNNYNEKSYYMYVGNNVVYEKRGDKDLYLWYDSYGYLAAFQVCFADGSSLRTIATTNKEGDVLGLYSLAGEQLVSYEYDSWGNLISFTD
ncbi:MAG: hypothetical protein IJN56_00055, partial [Clostridia bacterium]|nr:hypothetical protein [Clostridia bacterium]